jgi:hypothetical protein
MGSNLQNPQSSSIEKVEARQKSEIQYLTFIIPSFVISPLLCSSLNVGRWTFDVGRSSFCPLSLVLCFVLHWTLDVGRSMLDVCFVLHWTLDVRCWTFVLLSAILPLHGTARNHPQDSSMVCAPRAVPSLAADQGSLCRLDFRGDASTDPGRHGDPLL